MYWPAQEQLTCFPVFLSYHHQVTSQSKWKPGVPGALHGHESKPHLCSHPWVWCHFKSLHETKCFVSSVFMFTESFSSGPWSSLFHYLWRSHWMGMPPQNEVANIKVFHYSATPIQLFYFISWFVIFMLCSYLKKIAFLVIFLPYSINSDSNLLACTLLNTYSERLRECFSSLP